MKVFISQSPKRKTTDELRAEEAQIVSKLKERYDEDIEVVSASTISASAEGNPLYVLAKVIEALSTADIAIFAPGWSKQMSVEMDAARTYGVPIVDYEDLFYDLFKALSKTPYPNGCKPSPNRAKRRKEK